MADENKSEETKAGPEAKAAEDLTPTPTQGEMDEIMAKMTGATEAPKKPEAKSRSTEDLTPHMTQEENDMAMRAAAPGDFPPEGSTDPQRAEREREAKRKKELEAEQSAGYQTRAASPVKK